MTSCRSSKRIADETVTDLKRKHDRAMRDELRKEWSEQAKISSGSGALARTSLSASTNSNARTAAHVKQLRVWQQEADLWELFRIMLELHPFEADAHSLRTEREEKLAKLGPPHRYMSRRRSMGEIHTGRRSGTRTVSHQIMAGEHGRSPNQRYRSHCRGARSEGRQRQRAVVRWMVTYPRKN